jgi:hypothetical protein
MAKPSCSPQLGAQRSAFRIGEKQGHAGNFLERAKIRESDSFNRVTDQFVGDRAAVSERVWWAKEIERDYTKQNFKKTNFFIILVLTTSDLSLTITLLFNVRSRAETDSTTLPSC